MVSVYLLHSGACYTADEALYMFGKMRTLNGKGVTIPRCARAHAPRLALLKRVRLTYLPAAKCAMCITMSSCCDAGMSSLRST